MGIDFDRGDRSTLLFLEVYTNVGQNKVGTKKERQLIKSRGNQNVENVVHMA